MDKQLLWRFVNEELAGIKGVVSDLDSGHYSDSTHDAVLRASDALQVLFNVNEAEMNNQGINKSYGFASFDSDYGTEYSKGS